MRHLLPAGALALALSTAARAAGPTVASLARDYDGLSLSGAPSRVENAKLTAGHMTLTFASGSHVPVVAGDRKLGFFFVGKGSFEYRAVDPIELPLVQFLVKKATSVKAEKAEKSLVLKDGFTEILVLAANVELPKTEAGGGTALDAAFKAHRETFARIEEAPPSSAFVQQRLDAPSAGALRVEASGGADTWTYRWDSIDETDESLDVIRKEDIRASQEVRKHLWPTTISSQGLRDRRDPPPPLFVVTDIAYALKASKGREAKLSVTETVVPLGRPRSVFGFGLHNAVWDASGSGHITVRSVNLRSATLEDGTPLSFLHDHGSLLVGLPAPAAPEKPLKIRFEIDGDFLVRPQGDSYWLLEGNWLPLPDHQTGRLFTVHADIRVAKPFVPFAPGVTKSRREEGDENVLVTEFDKPI
ncbi:MAG TPA: hypothetical protein VKF32_11750, partial [Thermoanaerobaculia bacterium]|nr:hypothetical protein [Thermoanaerobaculia bacterium]